MSNNRLDQIKAMLLENPEDSFLNFALAKEHEYRSDNEAALGVYQKLAETDPNYTGTYYHLVKLLSTAGRDTEAIECADKGLEICKMLGDKHAFGELSQLRWEISDDE